VRLRARRCPVLPNLHTSEYSYAQTVDHQHCESTSNNTVQTYYNAQRQSQQNKSINNKTYDIQLKITLKKAEAKKEVSSGWQDCFKCALVLKIFSKPSEFSKLRNVFK